MDSENKKYRQKRIFDVLFNPQKGKWILILLFLLISLELALFYFGKNEKTVGQSIFVIVFIMVFTVVWLFFCSPKCFYFDGKTIEFYNYRNINSADRDGNRKVSFFVRRGWWFKKEHYILSELENVTFSQNPIESIFNTGRITFSGMGICNVKKERENITHKYKFTLYGIANFSEFKTEFQQMHKQR